MENKSEKKQSSIKKKKSKLYISRTPTSPRVKMFAEEYMKSGMSRADAFEKARQDVNSEMYDMMRKYNEGQNKSGCLVALIMLIAPTILLSLLIF